MATDKPTFEELATTTGGRDVTRGFVDALDLLQPQDSVLMARGAGDLKIYEEVLRDDQVMATFQQRRRAVISRDWEVEAGGKSRVDKRAADFAREVISHIDWDDLTDLALFGVYYGYSVAECLWARDGARLYPEQIKVRNRRRFRFAADGALRLLTSTNHQGEVMPPRKFWTFVTGADNDDEPYGRGLGHWLYWPAFFKRNGIKFWLIFLEKFAGGTAHGTYPIGAKPEEKKALLQALAAIQTDAGIATPEGMKIALLQAARSGTADYMALCKQMDAAISKVVLGQTMTTDDGSSRSQAEVHMDVRQDLVKADADLVCVSFSLQVLRWLTEWNFPGAKTPRVWRLVDDEPDLTAQATREKIIFDMGYRPTLRHVVETYGGEWEATGVDVETETTEPQPADVDAEFAEGDEEGDPPSEMAGQLDDATATVMDGMVNAIREIVETSTSLEEVRDRLLDAHPHMDPGELAETMQRALVAAELGGMADVGGETTG